MKTTKWMDRARAAAEESKQFAARGDYDNAEQCARTVEDCLAQTALSWRQQRRRARELLGLSMRAS